MATCCALGKPFLDYQGLRPTFCKKMGRVLKGEVRQGSFDSLRGVCWLIWWAPDRRGVGGAPQEGRRSQCQVFDEAEWYGMVAVRRG